MHANWFGLIYKYADYTNGNNDNLFRIVTYHYSTGNINIPLFQNLNGTILLNEIKNFSNQIAQSFNLTKIDEFAEIISCNVGFNAIQNNCKLGAWFEDDKSIILIEQKDNDELMSIKNLPLLHKMLFYYTFPSQVIGIVDGEEKKFKSALENLILKQVDMGNCYKFTTKNREYYNKFTDKPNAEASPLILAGAYYTDVDSSKKVYEAIGTAVEDYSMMC